MPVIQRETTLFIKNIKTVSFCGNEIIELAGDVFNIPFFTYPTKGEHDYNVCPGCQKNLLYIQEMVRKRFDLFPVCCDFHKPLLNAQWFEITKFRELDIPRMVSEKVIFSYQHILNNIEAEDYFLDITDYLDFTISSFGQFPEKFGPPLFLVDYIKWVIEKVEKNKGILKAKKKNILEYLNAQLNPRKVPETDLNILVSTYNKWLKIFPFNLSYFNQVKEDFEKTLPILSTPLHKNKYDGISRAKLHTKSSLIDLLMNRTNSLLTKFNGLYLYEKGLISDPNKIKLELVIENRRLKLNQGYTSHELDEDQKFRKIIKEWFNDEKKFFEDISPLIEISAIPHKKSLGDQLDIKLREYGFYEIEKVKQLSPLKQTELLLLVKNNNLPYKIAMFGYLGFIEYLDKNYFTIKDKRNREISKWMGADPSGRTVKGNLSTLGRKTTENKSRYTAYQYKETVEKDYLSLK